jgi:hypothetical protein
VKVHNCNSINIVEQLKLRKIDQKAMQEANGVGPPRYVVIEEKRRNDE